MTTQTASPNRKYLFALCAGIFAVCAAMLLHAQASPNLESLREQLRAHYNIVALQDELALVPRQRRTDIKIIEIRDGAVAINGSAVTAREARQRLGADADLIFRLTYLDASAQRQLAAPNSGSASQPESNAPDNGEPESANPPRTQVRSSDLVRIGGGVTVTRDELVAGDVVAIGGSADIDGEVTRDVTVIGGSLNLGPEALVHRDVTVVGGTLNRAPGARVEGKVSNVGFGSQFAFRPRPERRFPFRAAFSSLGGFVGTLLRISLLILFGLIAVLLGGRFVDTIANRTASEPLRSGITGLIAELLFIPLLVLTVVVLAVSIIGIPLLFLVPFAVVLAVVFMIIGFTGVASVVGRFVGEHIGMRRGRYLSIAVGILAVVGLTLIARISALIGGFVFGAVVATTFAIVGFLVEYVAWTVGIGAVILTWLGRRGGTPPPPSSGSASPAASPVAG